MSGRAFRRGLLGIFLLALAAKAAQLAAYGCANRDLFVSLLPNALGGALATVALAGIIPLIWLAVRRFDLERARGALSLWLAFALVLLALAAITARYQHGLC